MINLNPKSIWVLLLNVSLFMLFLQGCSGSGSQIEGILTGVDIHSSSSNSNNNDDGFRGSPTPTPTPTPGSTPTPSPSPTPNPTPPSSGGGEVSFHNDCNVNPPSIPAATGNTYYFSDSGNDANDGLSPATAKRNIEVIPQIAVAEGAGTHFYLRRGDTFVTNQSMMFQRVVGTESDPVVISAYGSGDRPIIDGHHTGNVLIARGDNTNPTQYVRFDSLQLTTTRTAAQGRPSHGIYTGEGFYSQNPHHITFSNLHITGVQMGGVIYGEYMNVTHTSIERNFKVPAHESGFSQGIFSDSYGSIFQNNYFSENGRPDSWFDHGFYIGGDDNIVRCNLFTNETNSMKIRQAENILVAHNIFHDEPIAIIAGGDSDGGNSGIRIIGNTFIRVHEAIWIKSQSGPGLGDIDFLIANNIFLESGSPFNAPWGGNRPFQVQVDNSQRAHGHIINNLFFNMSEENININNPGNITVANNILSRFDGGSTSLVTANSAATVQNNLEFLSLSSFAGLQLVNISGNDPLNWDFHLTSSSTQAIDTGLDYTGILPVDIDGVSRTRGSAMDIGPYEF